LFDCKTKTSHLPASPKYKKKYLGEELNQLYCRTIGLLLPRFRSSTKKYWGEEMKYLPNSYRSPPKYSLRMGEDSGDVLR
jgi:hypothetical protein